jgi:hypothetical protein
MRAVRATIVVPGLFALTYKVIGDTQMTLYATFGGFATLIFANFGGTRRDKLVAHFGLAVAGSLALIIGTVVSGITWLAALVTIPVAAGGGPRRRTERRHLFWVPEHLRHLRSHVNAITGPATRLAEIRRQPWWR